MYNQEVTINVGEEAANAANKSNAAPAKERPIWLTDSTVEGAVTEPMDVGASGGSGETSQGQRSSKKTNEEIMRALLAHESRKGTQVVIPEDNRSDESDASSDDENDQAASTLPVTNDSTMQMDSGDDDEEDEEEVTVMVAGKPVPFSEVTDEQVALMTPGEKEEYIKLGQEAYAAMYE